MGPRRVLPTWRSQRGTYLEAAASPSQRTLHSKDITFARVPPRLVPPHIRVGERLKARTRTRCSNFLIISKNPRPLILISSSSNSDFALYASAAPLCMRIMSMEESWPACITVTYRMLAQLCKLGGCGCEAGAGIGQNMGVRLRQWR